MNHGYSVIPYYISVIVTDSWLAFVWTVIVLAFIPGPSMMLAYANGMRFGWRQTTKTILGDLSANALQMLVAVLMLSVVQQVSPETFAIMKWLGVIYLIYLGLKNWFSETTAEPPSDGRAGKLFLQGFVVSAVNPKAILFFAGLFPLFIRPSLPVWPQFFLLATTYLAIDGDYAANVRVFLESAWPNIGKESKEKDDE